MPGLPLDAERLGHHGRALRRLARGLVRDDDLAQDLVQETWLATLRSPPDPDRPLRPWLFEVLRNLVRAGHRADSRRARRDREFTASGAGIAPSPEHALGSAQLGRLVAEVVQALEEPLRSTVILRYVEGRSAVDIARAQDVPAATVRSRARDGLERIRAELDRRHGGDRRAWRFALLPLAGSGGLPGGVRPALTGGARPLTVGIAAVSLVTIALSAGWWLRRAAPTGRATSASAGAAPRPLAATGPPRPAVPGTVVAGGAVGPGNLARGGFTLRGRVLDSSRIPLAGADVVAAGSGRRFQATTDGAGAFILTLPPGRHQVRAEAGGFAAGKQSIELSSDATTDFFLDPGATVEGKVVLRGTDQPVPGAAVVLLDRGRGFFESPATTSDREGRFAFADLPAGDHALLARGEELTGTLARPLRLAAADRVPDVVLEVAPGAAVSGRVRGDGDQPLAGASVELGMQGVPGIRIRGRADAQGRFRLDGVLPGSWWVLAASPGYLTGYHRELVVAVGGARVDLTLVRGATLQGQLVDERRQGVAGALITAVDGRHTQRGTARTGLDGTFRLADLPAGPLDLRAIHLERGAGAEASVLVGRQDLSQVVLVLVQSAAIAGRVRWQDGAPVPAAIVSAIRITGAPSRKSTETGPDGRFEIAALSPGRYIVDARLGVLRFDGGRFGDNPGRRTVDLAPGQTLPEVALVLARLDRELTGTVLDAEGHPIAGATVIASPVDARGRPIADNLVIAAEAAKRYQVATSADGSFRIAQLPAGPVRVTAEHPGAGRHQIASVPAGTEGLRLELTRP